MADGKIIIDTELDTDGIEKDLKQAEKITESSAKRIKKTFDEMSKESGKSVAELKKEAKALAEEYQKQGYNIPNSFKKAYDVMGVYSDNAAKTMKKSAQDAADKTSKTWKDSFGETEKSSTSAQKSMKSDAEKMKNAQEKASEKSKKAWKNAFDHIKTLSVSAVQATATTIAAVSTALIGAGAYATTTGIEFESAFAGVKKTVDATDTQIKNLRTSLIEMSKEMPQSASALSEISEAAGQLGIETNNIESFTKVMAQLGDATNLSATDAADSLARFANITGMSQTEFDRLGSTIVALGNNLATTESEIVAMGMRLAGAGSQVRMTESQIMSFAAALSSVGIEAEAGGSAFSTVMAKMQLACENGGDSLDDFAKVAGMSSGEFKSAFEKDAAGAIMSFIEGLANCEEQGKSAIGVLSDMGIEEIRQRDALLRAAGASDVFSKALGLGSQAWEENTALANEATQRYETLESKLAMAKNSVDALAIAFKDSVDTGLRNAVEQGTDYINELSEAFTNGGLEAAVDKSGDIIAELATKIAQSAPEMVDASTDLIKAFTDGLVDNKQQLKQASQEIVDAICEGMIKLLPKEMQEPVEKALDSLERTFKAGTKNMLNVSKSTLELIAKIFTKLADNMDSIIPIVVSMVAAYKSFNMVNGPVQTVVSVFMKLKSVSQDTGLAVAALNSIMNANPATLIAGTIALLVAGLATYIATADRADESQDAFNRKMDELGASIEKTQNELDSLKESMANTSSSIEASTAPIEKWQDKLGEAFDSTGKVKEGCEDMANYILNQLNEAMGTNYQLSADGFIENNEGIKQSLDEVNETIDEYVQTLKLKSLQEATSNQFIEAIQRQGEAQADLNEAQKAYNAALADYSEALKNYQENGDLKGLDQAQANLDKTRGKISEASKAAAEATYQVTGLDAVMDKLAEGTPESVQEALDMYARIPVESSAAAEGIAVSQKTIQQALSSTDYTTMTEGFQLAVMQIEESGGQIPASLRDSILEAMNEFQKMGPEGQEQMRAAMGLMLEGMSEEIPEFQDASIKTSDEILRAINDYLISSGAMYATGREIPTTLANGMTNGKPVATTAAGQVVEESANTAKQKAAEKKPEVAAATNDMMQGVPEGASTVDTSTVPTQKINEATNAAVTAAQVGEPQIAQAVQNAAAQINAGYQNSDVVSGASQAGSLSVQALIDAINTLKITVEQASAAVGQSAAQGLSSSDMPSAFSRQGSDAVLQVSNTITKNAGAVSSAASALGQASANALKGVNLSSAFQTQARTAVNMFVTTIRSQSAIAVSATRTLGTNVINGLKGLKLGTKAQEQGQLFGSGLATGIRDQGITVSGAASAIGNSAQNALSGFSNTGRSIGLLFSNGVAVGIRTGAAGVAAAAASVAKAAAEAAKANLEIRSPSRVGGYIGRMFDLGIEQDVRKGASGIEKAVKSVTDSMKINPDDLLISMRGAFGSTIDRIAANNAVKNTPVILQQASGKEGDVYQTVNFNQPVKSAVEMQRALRKEARRLAFL